MEQDIIDNYKYAALQAADEAARYKTLENTCSLLRLGIFALIIAAICFGVVEDSFTVMAVLFILLMFCFVALVQRQSGYVQKRKYFHDLERVNENEITSILTHGNLYDNGSVFNNEKHFYSADLDIFGGSSLFQLINRAATPIGNVKLAGWLSAPAKKEAILSRQDAVKEIAGKGQWKPEMQTLLLFANNKEVNLVQGLFKYLHTPLNLPGEKWLSKYTKIAPVLLTALTILAWFFPVIKTIAILTGLINLSIVFSRGMYIKKADLIAGKIGDTLARYAIAFQKIEQEKWGSVYATELVAILQRDNTSGTIKQLAELINKLNYHLNLIVGFILNLFFLWDIRQIIAIENWKRDNHASLEDAFDVIAEFEALISLSSLKINYPEWSTPQIADGKAYTLIAKNLAHPLISSKTRVQNDYELADAFAIDIITGSNMAGKSTYLRTIGINTVLALCGAPVCADFMQVSVMTIISYMRIKDSLNESTSTFKAELDRLQMLLAAVENEYNVFFLIDEMLRGTNSVDKYRGSKAVIEQLISKHAVGMVATHDLQIAQLEQQYPDYVRNFYFDIQIQDGEMLFDYKLKHGECKTFNATLLLKQIGIDIN